MKCNTCVGASLAVVLLVVLIVYPRFGIAAAGTAPASPALMAALGPQPGSNVNVATVTNGGYEGKLVAVGPEWVVVDVHNGLATAWIARAQVQSIFVSAPGK